MSTEPGEKPNGTIKKDGIMTLIMWALALDGFSLMLWTFMGVAVVVLIVIFVAAGGRF